MLTEEAEAVEDTGADDPTDRITDVDADGNSNRLSTAAMPEEIPHNLRAVISAFLIQMHNAELHAGPSGELLSRESTLLTAASSGNYEYPYGGGIAQLSPGQSLDEYVQAWWESMLPDLRIRNGRLCSQRHTVLTPHEQIGTGWYAQDAYNRVLNKLFPGQKHR